MIYFQNQQTGIKYSNSVLVENDFSH